MNRVGSILVHSRLHPATQFGPSVSVPLLRHDETRLPSFLRQPAPRRVLPGGLCPLVTLKAGAPAVLPPPLPLAYLIWFPPSLWLHYKLALLVKLEASAGCTAAFVRWLHCRPALLLYCRLCFRWFILYCVYIDIYMRVEICIDMYIDRNMGIYI